MCFYFIYLFFRYYRPYSPFRSYSINFILVLGLMIYVAKDLFSSLRGRFRLFLDARAQELSKRREFLR